MFRGLKKVFSKGHSSEVEAIEADIQQFDAPVVVRPRSKSVASASPSSEVTTCSEGNAAPARTSPTQTNVTGHTVAASQAGKNAWSLGDLGENASPARHACKPASALPPASSTGILQQHNLATTASSLHPLPPSSSGTAWGSSPAAPASPEKESNNRSAAAAEVDSSPPKQQSRMSGLFRSGSKNARSSAADESTVVEALGSTGDFSADVLAERVRDTGNRSARGAPGNYGRCAKGNNVESIALESSVARGGALRAGALTATPQAL